MYDGDEDVIEPLDPPHPRQVGIELAVVALALPVVFGCVLFFVDSFFPALAISAAAVVVSSLLVAIDAGRLGRVDLQGRKHESPVLLFVAMLLLWIVVYPCSFFRRRQFGGPNLGGPAILVALFLVGAPFLREMLIPPGLPACDSREAVQLLDRVIRGSAVGAKIRFIDGHREIGYDREAERRQGQCVAHTDGDDIVVNYFVEWQDRKKGMFQVRIPPADLPSCTSPQVEQLLEQAIRSTPVGAKAKSIDGHREIRYDREADRRQGQCVLHADGSDIVVNYVVEWQDRDKGLLQVRIAPAELPSCTSRETVQLLEQVIRGTPVGAKAKSIDGHREVSYDRAAERRQGQCVIHVDGPDVLVNYIVEWRDRDKGLFGVRILQ